MAGASILASPLVNGRDVVEANQRFVCIPCNAINKRTETATPDEAVRHAMGKHKATDEKEAYRLIRVESKSIDTG